MIPPRYLKFIGETCINKKCKYSELGLWKVLLRNVCTAALKSLHCGVKKLFLFAYETFLLRIHGSHKIG